MDGAIADFIGFFVFLILAIVFSNGRGAFLIAGYNTLPAREKAKYDEVALCKFMGKIMYGLSFSLLLWGVSDMFELPLLFTIGTVLFVSLIVFLLVYANTGNRFKKDS